MKKMSAGKKRTLILFALFGVIALIIPMFLNFRTDYADYALPWLGVIAAFGLATWISGSLEQRRVQIEAAVTPEEGGTTETTPEAETKA
ncbi:MAG: hypothetical protein JEZ04_22455 [Spirochaetales bacterium]|nr:hypothetical protein [Spirochaetales bacterium]